MLATKAQCCNLKGGSHYPQGIAIGFPNTYPLDSDLSGSGCSKHGWC